MPLTGAAIVSKASPNEELKSCWSGETDADAVEGGAVRALAAASGGAGEASSKRERSSSMVHSVLQKRKVAQACLCICWVVHSF